MEHQYGGGGSWTMIPNVQTHSNVSTPSNQDNLYLHHQPQPQQQQQFQPQQSQLYQQQQQQQQPQPQQQPLLLLQQQQQQQQIQQQQQQQQQQHHQSLASHFHLFHFVSKLAEAIDNGNRDQQSDALISDLNTHFEKCQQLLNSISGSISTKAMTVEGQRRKLEETEQMLNQRRDLINKYINSVEQLVKSEP